MSEEFIRTDTRASGSLTDAEKAEIDVVTKEWVEIAYRTGRTDHEALIEAIKALYTVVNHPTVPIVVVVPSPYVMTVAGSICERYLRLKKVGNDLAAYKDVQKVLNEFQDSPLISYVKDAVQQVLHLPDSPDGLTDAGGVPDSTPLSLSDYVQGGNFWPALPAFYAACRDVLKLKLPCFETYKPWEACAQLGGYRWISETFCLVCDYPDLLKVDEQFRPHNTEGPSHAWSDGWKLWHIDGIAVTEQIVMAPETITAEQIAAEQNEDIKAIMIARANLTVA